MMMFFLFNDTGTTEIYTDLHTLSLHDALPICTGGLDVGIERKIDRAARAVRPATEAKAVYGSRLAAIVDTGKAAAAADRLDQHRVRAGPACDDIRLLRERNVAAVATCTASRTKSEEHTSELQSLMRISYAVFCLKKKTNTHTHTQTHSIQQLPTSE